MPNDLKKFTFSKTRLEALPVPDAGRVYHYDEKTPGLALCVTSAGARTFYLYRKVSRRPVRVRIGPWPSITIDQARTLAASLNVAIAAGHDPQEAKQARRREATFGELFASYLEIHAKAHLKESTWREYQRLFDTLLPELHGRKLSAIHKRDVQALHSRIGDKNGRYAANRVLALVRSVFNKAELVAWKGENPAEGIKPFPEQSRDRFLQPAELSPFFDALNQEPDLFRDYFFFALLTGARRSNCQAARWEDISFELAIWRIPETKSGKPVLVPLSGPALDLLRDRAARRDGNPWVFPSPIRPGAHITEIKSAWARVLKRAGLTDVRPHDLRRSLGSWQALSGASLPIIGKSLGHSQPITTQIYARLTLDPVRESVEKATEAIRIAAGGKLPRIGQNGGQSNGEV